jgi:hypothetical protein
MPNGFSGSRFIRLLSVWLCLKVASLLIFADFGKAVLKFSPSQPKPERHDARMRYRPDDGQIQKTVANFFQLTLK